MFTGIITAIGRITQAQPLGPEGTHGQRLTVQTPKHYLDDVDLGHSIALNGACMTVTTLAPHTHSFTVDISLESLAKTTGLQQSGPINLEKALQIGDRLGGHLVSGHVDGIGQVTHFAPTGESWTLRVQAPAHLAKFLAYKGSITLNGVSLTINEVTDSPHACEISLNLIPHTLAHTTLGQLQPGQHINIEVDTIARYVERMLGGAETISSR